MAQQILSTNTFGCAKWIVSSDATQGTHTTIASALTSASSGDTIFIRPGTYTENLTLKAGVNLTAFGSESSLNQTGNVIISGKCTFTGVGSVTISGIELQTNSDFLLAITGSAASVVNLQNCNLNCTNNTGISHISSSSSSNLNIYNCTGNLGTTGIALISDSSAGALVINNSFFSNSGSSTTASTKSSTGIFRCTNTVFVNSWNITSSGNVNFYWTSIDLSSLNATALTVGAAAPAVGIFHCYLASGTASAISIAGTLNAYNSDINSTNTNAITGAGTITYAGLTFSSTSKLINTTTQSGGLLQGGLSQAPSAGFIGEQIRSFASGVTVGNSTPTTVTSINITAGIWDISAIAHGTQSTGNMTAMVIGISTATNSFTGTTNGDNENTMLVGTSVIFSQYDQCIPSYRVTLTATTTYYLVVQMNNSVGGTNTVDGRISATRVG